jgi:hypothetical protein
MSHLESMKKVIDDFVSEYRLNGRVLVNIVDGNLVIDDLFESGQVYNSITIRGTWDNITVSNTDGTGKSIIFPAKEGMDYFYLFMIIICNFDFINMGRYM